MFLAQIFFLGIAFNAAFVIMESRTNPKLLAVAIELTFSIGCGSTMVLPVLAKAPEPTPTILFLVFGSVCVIALCKIGPRKQELKKETIIDKIEHTILSMIDESRQEGNSFGGFRANMSSVILDSKYIQKKVHSKWRRDED